MNVLWPIAIITLKEGIRNRAIYGISFFALLLLGLNLVVASMIPRDIVKFSVDMALSTISFSGLLVVLFVGINLVAKDLDRKTIYMVLSKPISRSQYILGKFFGIILLLFLTVSFISVFAFGCLFILKVAYVAYFVQLSWPLVFLGIFFILITLILLSSLSFLFASFSSTSFITLVLTIITYLIGQSLGDIKALIEAGSITGESISPITRTVVQVAYYLFPNLSFFDIKTQVAHGLQIPVSTVFWTVLYGFVYTALIITAAALIFRKKEFP
jgi:ABC-type transport system involved in multi-copper enzyme maturation permease subunit